MKKAPCWLAAIWLMEHGVALSSSGFHELVDISQTSALKLIKRINTVLQSHMPESAPTIPSSFFSIIFAKRSLLTPANAHPRAEQDEIDKAMAAESQTNTGEEEINNGEPLSELEVKVYALLSEVPIDFDTLCQRAGISAGALSAALTMLELNHAAERMSGDYYVRSVAKGHSEIHLQCLDDDDFTDQTRTAILAFIDLVRFHWRGISRRFLQKYLAAHWCYIDRTTWPCGSLLQACLLFGKVNQNQLVNYVTPPLVKICPYP